MPLFSCPPDRQTVLRLVQVHPDCVPVDDLAGLLDDHEAVSKVYFPRLVIPAGAVMTWVPDFVISSGLLFVLMAVFKFMPPITALSPE